MKLLFYCTIIVLLCKIQCREVRSAEAAKDKLEQHKTNDNGHLDPINNSKEDYYNDDYPSSDFFSESNKEKFGNSTDDEEAHDESNYDASEESSWSPADDDKSETGTSNEASHEVIENKELKGNRSTVTWSSDSHLNDKEKELAVNRWIYISIVLGCVLLAVLLMVSVLRLRKIAKQRTVSYDTLHEEA